ncbi:DUF2877 domain-containing protein [Streptomyces mesophilus]|uniref:DUF2877 domain-containing protein n=1 Tax=Streptomyces mesophilus TaxID=1775132 RepID=UPI00332029CF
MSPAALPCAASTLVEPLVQGRRRRARVVGVTGKAVYLLPYEEESAGNSSLLALVAPTGVRVPSAVLLSRAAGERPFTGIDPGAVARIGGGRVELGPLRLAAGVSWAPPRVQGTPVAQALPVLARFGPPRQLPGGVAPFARNLAEALGAWRAHAEARPDSLRAPALALLGRGPGLTPSGDDYLCGLLLAANAAPIRPSWGASLADALAGAHEHTTLISASLLAQAATGHCIPQVHELLSATAAAGEVPPGPLAALLAVGHSSGSDLLHGLCAGARLLTGPE